MCLTYITFGQAHSHEVNGRVFDKDCVAVIKCNTPGEGRDIAFDTFGGKWAFQYQDIDMARFPRGMIAVNFPQEEL